MLEGHPWRRAIASFEQADRVEAAWARAHAASDLFRADGRLNDRSRARAKIAEALSGLSGSESSSSWCGRSILRMTLSVATRVRNDRVENRRPEEIMTSQEPEPEKLIDEEDSADKDHA
jgi:hypothetical protein